MRVELRCPGCGCHFPAAPESPMGEALARLAEQGPWSALGDGETLEDMIVAALPGRGMTPCPRCGAPVAVSEESLGQFSLELLHQW